MSHFLLLLLLHSGNQGKARKARIGFVALAHSLIIFQAAAPRPQSLRPCGTVNVTTESASTGMAHWHLPLASSNLCFNVEGSRGGSDIGTVYNIGPQ